ncbi:DUF3016 domain-containing protein [Shewanella sp. JM162201]|uniref:DUF3016 domain-containing protein n=1 Tax=Shewanella jiangmenensis TaxID=2837387 RepID=A0ABS5V535_9GAMM|nr:DUF3016 domain-containing protein [Shewanella jiangmenensis]MBT1444163.1 DUF3016 domain-containing protein [Shewanella jiangmenensis]
MKYSMILVAGLFVAGSTMAADDASTNPVTEDGSVKITWQEPKKFRDVKSSGEVQSRYENRMFETLTKELNKQASKSLKANQKLELVVTDVDLAGDVRPTFGATANDLRIVKEIYPPRMTFSYQVLDGDQVVIAGDEKLSNLNFMNDIRPVNDKPFMHESRLLTQWFDKQVAPKL